MYRIIEDFLTDWEYEAQAVSAHLERLDQEDLNLPMPEGIRTAGRLAWHIVQSPAEMLAHSGFEGISEAPFPERLSVEQLKETWLQIQTLVRETITSAWKDADLFRDIPMYGETWKAGKMLNVLIMHQAHHRAQLGIILHLLGKEAPGVYGPARQEWAAMGMNPAE